jgi:tRNA(fMet)-specific endonuclease VapC
MLDTNIVSHLIKGHTEVIKNLVSKPISSICISSITEAELLFGLAKRPDMKKLHQIVHEFLLRTEVLSWDSQTAQIYGKIRAKLESTGKIIGCLDLLIASHALSENATLITNDKAITQIDNLNIQDWTISNF